MNSSDMVENEIEYISACPNCGSGNIKIQYEARDIYYHVTPEIFNMSVCNECKTLFLSKRPKASAAWRYYPDTYGPYNANRSAAEGVQRSFVEKILLIPVKIANAIYRRTMMPAYLKKLERISTPADGLQTVLDFGCGDDKFLNPVKRAGRITIGMDFTPSVIEKISKNGHQGVLYDGPHAWDQIPDNSVDFVRMSHVAEHLYDQQEVFSRLHSKLKPGGSIHVIVPNPSGISGRRFGKYSLAYADIPRHVILCPLNAMIQTLTKKGFVVADTLQELVMKDYIRSIYIRRHYENLDLKAMYEYAYNPSLNELLLIPMAIAALFNKADRYHLIVVKSGR